MNEGRSSLGRSVQYVKGVGPRRAERLARLGVRTAGDLLMHLPHRYEDATTVARIASLRTGDDVTVIGRVISKGILPTRRGLKIFHAVLRDASGMIECAWPGQPWLDRSIRKGDLLLASGSVRFYHGRQLQPREFTTLAGAGEEVGGDEGCVFPIYPATDGLSHRQIRAILEANLDDLLDDVVEVFEPGWLSPFALPQLRDALEALHRPLRISDVEPARRRLAFEELFFLQLLHARARERALSAQPGAALRAPAGCIEEFVRALPFELTEAQRRAWSEIRVDMERPTRMYRLLQGDVGSGKTVVAALAMLTALSCGRQAALMAPTELLAEQHARTLRELFAGTVPEADVALLTGSTPAPERRRVNSGLRDGSVRLVVGTHALIQAKVGFHSLGVVVIDEQQRFGVEQRRHLRDAGGSADALVMTATPIPRSLALTLYGDLDLSVIDELPPGRRRIVTAVRGPESREAAFEFVRDLLRQGRQAYFVYPLIEESEVVDARAAADMFDRLAKRFAEFRVGLLHGRMPSSEKDSVMRRFLGGDLDLLVSTSVIEVGIDVPNASVMIIEDAERFGLAQLHQLRGRVGRGAQQSYCVAFYSGKEVPERLSAFARTTDGFALAREDLRLRGEGDLFGAQQHGLARLRFADLERDLDLLEEVRRRARAVVADDPQLGRPSHRAFARRLAESYTEHEKLYGVG